MAWSGYPDRFSQSPSRPLHIGFISFFASAHVIVWPCLFFTCVMAISPTSVSS